VLVGVYKYADVGYLDVHTDDRDEDTKVHNTWDSPTSRCETDDEADADHGHEEENERGSLLASI
jgi:hypothetical protein